MVAVHKALAPSVEPAEVDQRISFFEATWEDYERLDALRRGRPNPRLTFLEGVLELMVISRSHELYKKRIARLIEAYVTELGLDLRGAGSYTMQQKRKKVAAESDECYFLGEGGEFPDLAIEVIWTHGGIDKLKVYERLRVGEVWVWANGGIRVFRLGSRHFREIARSELLPGLDPSVVASYAERADQTAAVRDFVAEVFREGPRPALRSKAR